VNCLIQYGKCITLHITGSKKQSEERAVLFAVRVHVVEQKLKLPGNCPKQWVVDCKAVGKGDKALVYLGRYLYRGVIQKKTFSPVKVATSHSAISIVIQSNIEQEHYQALIFYGWFCSMYYPEGFGGVHATMVFYIPIASA
jgi:hypothetical protein